MNAILRLSQSHVVDLLHPLFNLIIKLEHNITPKVRPFSVNSMVYGSQQRFFTFVERKKLNKNLPTCCCREIRFVFWRFWRYFHRNPTNLVKKISKLFRMSKEKKVECQPFFLVGNNLGLLEASLTIEYTDHGLNRHVMDDLLNLLFNFIDQTGPLYYNKS